MKLRQTSSEKFSIEAVTAKFLGFSAISATVLCAVLTGILLVSVEARAQSFEPGRCPNDSKLLNGGPTLVYGEGPGTFWGLVTNGLNSAGFVTDEEKIAYLNYVFGTGFNNLDDLRDYNLNLVNDSWDQNQNGYVCVYELRGTRANLGNPYINLTFFGISDDKLKKK